MPVRGHSRRLGRLLIRPTRVARPVLAVPGTRQRQGTPRSPPQQPGAFTVTWHDQAPTWPAPATPAARTTTQRLTGAFGPVAWRGRGELVGQGCSACCLRASFRARKLASVGAKVLAEMTARRPRTVSLCSRWVPPPDE